MTVELIDRLVETLNSEGIVYCHWKSNFSLAQALAGDLDLDLYVERRSLSQVLAILVGFGFKLAVVRCGPDTPGILHYYGLNHRTGQLVHVHLFSRVLTGESFVKSHLLPFESMLLETGDYVGQIRVAAKPAELVLFVLRTFIKYGSLLDLMYLVERSEDIRAELQWLQVGGDLSETLCLLREYCPVVDKDLFVQCVDTLDGDTSLVRRVMLAHRVRRRLRVYAAHTALDRILAYVHLLWGQARRRLGGNKKNKRLCAGGAVIAFVGPEATGKSTLVSACARWLGQAFAVRNVHAGKPPSSWLTAPVNVVLPLMRGLLPRLRPSRLEGHTLAGDPGDSQPKVRDSAALIYALRAVTLAWDRRQLLLRVRRAAARGEIVICDRYPSEAIGAMDSPRLREDPTKSGMIPVICNWLARLEQRMYRQIPPPDITLRLKVSIETAQKRNRERIKAGKETDVYVESRHRQDRTWYRSGTSYIYDIDTEQPLIETILRVKKAIWESL